jgi:hypothetical protein
MKKIILSLIVVSCAVFISGCGTGGSVTDFDGYRKVSMTLDVSTGSDGSIDGNACFGQGTIASVMYFPMDGGEPVSQTSTIKVNSVPCLQCYTRIENSVTEFPIELSAVLAPNSVEVNDADGNPLSMKDELRFWIQTPPINSLDIYYECGGAPDTLPDYGSAVAQVASPFMTSTWTQDLVLNEVDVSEFNDFAFPPTYLADIKISLIEEFADEIK